MTMTIRKRIIVDYIGDKYELYMTREGQIVDFYCAVLNSGNHYHVFGMDAKELNEWLEGREWSDVIKEYMEENDLFLYILDKECALEGLAEINFMRCADINYYSDLMKAFQDIQRGDYSPALKNTLRIIMEYFL